jgi:hypothetical protein
LHLPRPVGARPAAPAPAASPVRPWRAPGLVAEETGSTAWRRRGCWRRPEPGPRWSRRQPGPGGSGPRALLPGAHGRADARAGRRGSHAGHPQRPGRRGRPGIPISP